MNTAYRVTYKFNGGKTSHDNFTTKGAALCMLNDRAKRGGTASVRGCYDITLDKLINGAYAEIAQLDGDSVTMLN